MIPALSRRAAPAAMLLCLGVTTAAAQPSEYATDSGYGAGRGIAVESVEPDSRHVQVVLPAGGPGAAPATAGQPEALKQDAIRVPAMGTGATAEAGATDASAATRKKVQNVAPKPKKRARVLRRFHGHDVVYVRPHYAPYYYYAPYPHYRFGYGFGLGFMYGW